MLIKHYLSNRKNKKQYAGTKAVRIIYPDLFAQYPLPALSFPLEIWQFVLGSQIWAHSLVPGFFPKLLPHARPWGASSPFQSPA
jgi:hypothetical protein